MSSGYSESEIDLSQGLNSTFDPEYRPDPEVSSESSEMSGSDDPEEANFTIEMEEVATETEDSQVTSNFDQLEMEGQLPPGETRQDQESQPPEGEMRLDQGDQLLEGEMRHDQGNQPAAREVRLDQGNLNLKLDDYLRDRIPEQTKKSTGQAVRLYESVMSAIAQKEGKEFKTLKETPVDELPEALGRFIIVARKKDGSIFNASSLETYYQSIARYLASDYEPKLDIKRDPRFKIVQQALSRRCTEVAQEGARPGKNAAKAVSEDTIKLAYEKETLGRKNPKALITTVHYLTMTGFGCRAVTETYNIKNEDINYGPLDKNGIPKWIELSERITKTMRGRKNDVRDIEGKIYADNEHPEICGVRTLLEYQRRKTDKQNAPDCPYFMTVKQSAQDNPEREPYWYTNGRMGRNHIGKLFPNAFKDAGVDIGVEKIKATSCRKNLVQAGADGLVPGTFLSKMTNQKNLDSKLHYLVNKENSHQAASLVIQRKACGQSGPSFPEVLENLDKERKHHNKESNKRLLNDRSKKLNKESNKKNLPSTYIPKRRIGTSSSDDDSPTLKDQTNKKQKKVDDYGAFDKDVENEFCVDFNESHLSSSNKNEFMSKDGPFVDHNKDGKKSINSIHSQANVQQPLLLNNGSVYQHQLVPSFVQHPYQQMPFLQPQYFPFQQAQPTYGINSPNFALQPAPLYSMPQTNISYPSLPAVMPNFPQGQILQYQQQNIQQQQMSFYNNQMLQHHQQNSFLLAAQQSHPSLHSMMNQVNPVFENSNGQVKSNSQLSLRQKINAPQVDKFKDGMINKEKNSKDKETGLKIKDKQDTGSYLRSKSDQDETEKEEDSIEDNSDSEKDNNVEDKDSKTDMAEDNDFEDDSIEDKTDFDEEFADAKEDSESEMAKGKNKEGDSVSSIQRGVQIKNRKTKFDKINHKASILKTRDINIRTNEEQKQIKKSLVTANQPKSFKLMTRKDTSESNAVEALDVIEKKKNKENEIIEPMSRKLKNKSKASKSQEVFENVSVESPSFLPIKVGDKAFQIAKGTPPWPVKVTGRVDSKFSLYYYGTYETGLSKKDGLDLTPLNKKNLVRFKTQETKRKDLKRAIVEALEQVENN